MKQYLLFLLLAFLFVNGLYLQGSFGFLFDIAIYYMAGVILLGIIIFFFSKKYGVSLIIIVLITFFLSGNTIIKLQESVTYRNANKTLSVIEKYKVNNGYYPTEHEFKKLSVPKSLVGYIPNDFDYTLANEFYSLEYRMYHGYINHYNSRSNKWILLD